MVYSSKFVLSVLVNGVPQQEKANDSVELPFGTEYSLRFRNKNDRRAVVKFFIDGENVSGNGYIIDANDAIDLHRHYGRDARFKFVSLDSPDAVDFGKNGSNEDKTKGVIEARFYLERERPKPTTTVIHEHHHHDHYPWWPARREPYRIWNSSDNQRMRLTSLRDSDAGASLKRSLTDTDSLQMHDSFENNQALNYSFEERTRGADLSFNATSSMPSVRKKALRDGCTVEGGATGQTFQSRSIEIESDYVTLKVFLQGYDPENVPVQVKSSRKQVQAERLPEPKIDPELESIESENERLALELARLKNQKLRTELDQLKSESDKQTE